MLRSTLLRPLTLVSTTTTTSSCSSTTASRPLSTSSSTFSSSSSPSSSSSTSTETNQHQVQSSRRPPTLDRTLESGRDKTGMAEMIQKTEALLMNSSSSSISPGFSIRLPGGAGPTGTTTTSRTTTSGTESVLQRLSARLALKRKLKGFIDLDATAISNTVASVRRPAPRTTSSIDRTPQGDRLAEVRESRFANQTSAARWDNTLNRSTSASASASSDSTSSPSSSFAPRLNSASAPRSPRSPSSSSTRPAAGGVAAKPRGPRLPFASSRPLNSRSNNAASKEAVVLTPLPKIYKGIPTLDLASLIKEDLANNVLQLTTAPVSPYISKNVAKKRWTLAERLELRKQAQGDYSKYVLDPLTSAAVAGTGMGSVGIHAERARQLLLNNSTVGLEGREFVVEKVQGMMLRK